MTNEQIAQKLWDFIYTLQEERNKMGELRKQVIALAQHVEPPLRPSAEELREEN